MARFCTNCGNELADTDKVCTNCGTAAPGSEVVQQTTTTSTGEAPKSKIAAGLLGIFLGSLGIHNFYLGNNKRALIQLLVTLIAGPLTCGVAAVGMEIWGLIEGIQILTGSINTDANGNPLGQ